MLGGCLVVLAGAGVTASAASAACVMVCEDVAAKSALRIGADGQPDVVVVGRSQQGTDAGTSDSAVAVLDADGSPDTAFGGGDGAELVPVSAGRDEAHDVRVHPDGDLFLSGRADGDAYVARLNPDGSLDPACGGMDSDPGVERFDPPGGAVERTVLARIPDGLALVAETGSGEPGQVFKITDSCELVPTFGTAGFAALQFGTQTLTRVRDVEVDTAGNIFVGGGSAAAIGSLGPIGSPNTGFGFDGYLPFGPGSVTVTGLVLRPAGGWFVNAQFTTSSFQVGSVPADGSSVTSSFLSFGTGANIAGGVTAGDGDVFVTGRTPAGTTGVARKDGDTLADVNSFGIDGRTDFGPGSTGVDVAFLSDGTPIGKLVVSGFGPDVPGADSDFTTSLLDPDTGTDIGPAESTDFSGQEAADIGPDGKVPPPSEPPPPPSAEQIATCPVNPGLTRPCADLVVTGYLGFITRGASDLHRDDELFAVITVSNRGPDLADGVLLTASLPAQYQARLMAVLSGEGFDLLTDIERQPRTLCRIENDEMRCDLGRLAPGRSFRIVLRGFATRAGVLVLQAGAGARTGEVNLLDNALETQINVFSPDTRLTTAELLRFADERRGTIRGTVRSADSGGRASAARHAQARPRPARIAKVEIALVRLGGRTRFAQSARATCHWLRNARGRFMRRNPRRARCERPVWLKARLKGDRFSYRIGRRLPCGRYTLLVRATNRAGATEARFSRRDGNRADLRLC
jgi:hypothetical protein